MPPTTNSLLDEVDAVAIPIAGLGFPQTFKSQTRTLSRSQPQGNDLYLQLSVGGLGSGKFMFGRIFETRTLYVAKFSVKESR